VLCVRYVPAGVPRAGVAGAPCPAPRPASRTQTTARRHGGHRISVHQGTSHLFAALTSVSDPDSLNPDPANWVNPDPDPGLKGSVRPDGTGVVSRLNR